MFFAFASVGSNVNKFSRQLVGHDLRLEEKVSTEVVVSVVAKGSHFVVRCC